MSKISLRNISKSFGENLVLDKINLEIADGSFVSIVGRSGCGKTTLLKIIAGLILDYEGEVCFDDLVATSENREAIIVFQDYALFPHLSVFENIAYGLRVRKVNKAEINKRVLDILEVIGLIDRKDCLPKELSGGQQQRVCIARALVVNPKVLLLDEPFSGLDRELREVLKGFVLQVCKGKGITVLMVTHDEVEASEMSDFVVRLSGDEFILNDN